MSGFEKIRPIRSAEQQAQQMYNSLPEEMKVPYYGIVPEGLKDKKGDAGSDPLPYVVVKFKYGGAMALHLHHPDKAGSSYEEQAARLIEAGRGVDNIESVGLYWKEHSGSRNSIAS